MGAEGHDPRTLFVQVSIDLHERQATPGEVAHTRHKPTILLARLPWQRLELGLGVVHGLELVVLHAAPTRVEPPPRADSCPRLPPLGEGVSTVGGPVLTNGDFALSPQPATQSFAGPFGSTLVT